MRRANFGAMTAMTRSATIAPIAIPRRSMPILQPLLERGGSLNLMLDTSSLAPPPAHTEMAKPDVSAPPVRLEFPDWLEPMAATLTQERFTGPDWTFERKLDGIRMLAFKNGDKVRLLSRNKLPLDGQHPAVAKAVAKLPVHDVILDGEATWAW